MFPGRKFMTEPNHDTIKELSDDLEIQQIKSIFNSMGCGLSIVERVDKDDGASELRIRYINKRQKDEFGDLTGQICHQAYNAFPEPCPWCPVLKTFDDGKPHMSITYSPVRGNQIRKEWKRYLVVASPYEWEEKKKGNTVLEVIVDLTEREVFLESVFSVYSFMIDVESLQEVAQYVVELVADIMGWNIVLFFLKDKRSRKELKLWYEKGLGLDENKIPNIGYSKVLAPPHTILSPEIYEIDDNEDKWEKEKNIYPEEIQAKLQEVKKVFIFPLVGPFLGEIGALKVYSKATSTILEEFVEYDYVRLIKYIIDSAASACDKIMRRK
jgi:hypothetical protein